MSRKEQTRPAADAIEETTAAAVMPAPSSGLINPALAMAPLEIAREAAIGWLECWRCGLTAYRDRQDDFRRAWRGQRDAALRAAAELLAVGAPLAATTPTHSDAPLAANDAAPATVARRALASASFWLNGAQALTPFATQLGGPWWSALLDHDRRPQA